MPYKHTSYLWAVYMLHEPMISSQSGRVNKLLKWNYYVDEKVYILINWFYS